MKRALAIPLVLFAVLALAGLILRGAPAGAEPFVPGQVFNEAQVVAVTAAALSFIAPRTLEKATLPQLSMWGLRGLTTLDPRLTPDLRADDPKHPVLRLIGPSRVVLTRPAPGEADLQGWAEATGQMLRAGWDVSEPVRRAGTGGVIHTYFDEMFNHMDPYSRYAPPDEAAAERVRRAGRATLGIEPALLRGAFVVRAVQADGAAAEAGIRPGERIVSIDGVPAAKLDLPGLRRMLAGPEESVAVITLRGTDGRLRTETLVRRLLPPETVTARRLGTVLDISIGGFARNTATRLAQELIRGMQAQPPPTGIVLDLRGNRGGVLQQAVAAAAMLQPRGVVAVTAGRDPAAAHDFIADGRDLADGRPVVVMVDGRTASAAEILAAALADQRRAVVLGSVTLGKGLVQAITALPNGGELFVTWSRVLAPRGWPIQGLGVLPQVCTSEGAAAASRQVMQLERGIQPMAAALSRHRNARAPVPPQEMLDIRNACPAAEGREDDLALARRVLASPTAYATALLPPGPPPSVLGNAARPAATLTNATPTH